MNLKNFKLALPKTWKETSCIGGENQTVIHVYHINPLSRIDPKRLKDEVILCSEPNTSITRVAIPTTGTHPIQGFYEGMKTMITSGLMPPEWTMGKLNELWKGMIATPHAERPGESDLASDIEIIQCQDEEFAWQTLKNKGLMPTQGFDVPIPGGITAPGLPKNMTMSGILQSDLLKNYMPKEQWGQLEKMRSAIKEMQKQMPGIKQNFEKRGVKYKEGKYLGCKAIYLESPNPNPPPKPKSSSSGKDTQGGGGYGNTDLGPLPKVAQPYSTTNTFYLGLLVKNFIVGGPLLSMIEHLPLASTPCYSLTQTKEVVTTDRVEGVLFKGISIVPLVSNYAKEGYYHREEVEEMYRNIISKLK